MALARASFSSDDEVIRVRKPAAWANCRPKIETPPVPCSTTVSPGAKSASSNRARQAVRPAQGRVATCWSVRNAGTFETPCSLNTASSRPAPGIGEPSDDISFSTVGGPEIQFWKNIVATRSPGFTRVTPGPTASTTAQPSERGVIGPPVAGPRAYIPCTINRSR